MAKKQQAGGRQPPLRRVARAAHHREVDHAVRAECGRVQGRDGRVEARDQGRGRGAVRRQRDGRQHASSPRARPKRWKGKPYQRSDAKKAIVTLAEGETIDITKGLRRNGTRSNISRRRPARRGLILVDKSALWKGKPVKALTEGKRKTGGRNNKGHVTSRGIAGGHKQKYRIIDFKRRTWDVAGDRRAARV